MRRLIILAAFIAAPAGAAAPTFSDAMADASRRAADVRDGFTGIAPLEVWHKAIKLEPVERADAELVAKLEAITPTAERAACHADALDGARRADAAIKDMLRLYREGERAAAFGARVTAAARNADNGLTALEGALARCTR